MNDIDGFLLIRSLKEEEEIPYDLLLLADEEMQAIERYLHESDIYVAVLHDKPIGVYALYAVSDTTAEIKAIAVDEAYQDRGIGKRMLRHAEAEAGGKGFAVLLIGTPSIAAKQISIYEKAGFVLFDVKKDFFITHYTTPLYEDGIQLKDMVMLRKLL